MNKTEILEESHQRIGEILTELLNTPTDRPGTGLAMQVRLLAGVLASHAFACHDRYSFSKSKEMLNIIFKEAQIILERYDRLETQGHHVQ